jgi:hypothetical protein
MPHYDRIDAGLRHRAMRATPEQPDLQAVRRGGDRSRASGNGAGGADHDMLAKHDIGRGEASKQAVVDHGLRALCGFLAWLEDGHQRTLPGIARLRQQCRRADEPRYMHIMAAHMAHRHRVSFGIGRCDLAGIGKSGVLGDGERIHVRTQHHCRPFAVAEQSDHARLAHAGGHRVTGFSELVGGDARCSRLVHRQFGMGVNVLIKRFQFGEQLAQVRQHNGCAVGGGMLDHDVLLLMPAGG